MSHKSALEAVRKLTLLVGGVPYVLHQSGRLRGSAGIPDMYLMFPRWGVTVWFEVKVGKDKLSKAQRAFRDLAYQCGDAMLVGGVAELKPWLNRVAESLGEEPPFVED